MCTYIYIYICIYIKKAEIFVIVCILTGARQSGRPRKRWKEEVERDLQVLGVSTWREYVTGKNGRILFDKPKPTAGCSAKGRRRRMYFNITNYIIIY
jgi:hypothetical protein